IARNVWRSRWLGAKGRWHVEAPHDLEQLEERRAAPGHEQDELVGLDDALARMPAKLRRAILLREWQGLRYAEIAEALGITCSAAETLIFRARRYLARELESSSGRQLRVAS